MSLTETATTTTTTARLTSLPSMGGSGRGGVDIELGETIPPATPHAVSVSLPTWRDNVLYEEADAELHATLKSGYPRFVFLDAVQQLMRLCEARFAEPGEACMVLPTRRAAEECRAFVRQRLAAAATAVVGKPAATGRPVRVRLIELTLPAGPATHSGKAGTNPGAGSETATTAPPITLHVAAFPREAAGAAKQFWQHSGAIVSSRFAEHCLELLKPGGRTVGYTPGGGGGSQGPAARSSAATAATSGRGGVRGKVPATAAAETAEAGARRELATYVEERFGRNWDIGQAAYAKLTLRRRIAGVLGEALRGAGDDEYDDVGGQAAAEMAADGRQHAGEDSAATPAVPAVPRGVGALDERHILLTPCGMNAIYTAFRMVQRLRPGMKSVQFGFPYVDTLKIQEKFNPLGCHFLGHGNASDLDTLEHSILSSEPISAVFCEFPSNPLLRSPDLHRLRALADVHGFAVVVDETIGNFVNSAVLPWADVVVSSLTKIFSGESNVMGG
ncbi:hypothetical protein HK405_011502, partial [Cladochytrium tenue]